MHGLTMSINDRLKTKYDIDIIKSPSCFYSISKPVQRLNDMYLDLLITRWIDAMTHAVKRRQTYIMEGKESTFYISNRDNNRQAALQFWFNLNLEGTDYPAPINIRKVFKKFYNQDLPTLLADNILNYNPRTNSIHYRRLSPGDSDASLLFLRKHDTISDYVADYKHSKSDLRSYMEESEGYCFDSEFIDVKFDFNDKKDDDIIERNSHEATMRFFNIIRVLEQDLENFETQKSIKANHSNEQELQPRLTKGNFAHEVVVIDGFSHIDSNSLKTLPYNHLQSTLRKLSRISILVFDDRKDVDCDADIIIDLRKNVDENEEYTFFELQIAKSIFQTHAYGWHQYKRRDEGLVVFPSIHLLLMKRHYIANRIHDIGKGILDCTYEQFLEGKVHYDSALGALEDNNPTQMRDYFNEFYYEDFIEIDKDQDMKFLKNIIKSQQNLIKENDKFTLSRPIALKVLETALLGFPLAEYSYEHWPLGWTDHYPSTAIVGNPNSFKRKLVLSHAFHWARRKEHVLFVLFDKNEEDIRKQMVCPAINQRVKLGERIKKGSNKFDPCLRCYKYIHFFRVRTGCITSEEFFSSLLEQISLYCDEDPIYGIERRRLHIIIDDFQRIDFCFPFIRTSTLFTAALINICHNHNVELSILCDKSGERAREVCTLADNVICIERNQSDIKSISLYIERFSSPPFPSAILKYKIPDMENLFSCSKKNLNLNDKGISAEVIGSMKEYWRQTENVIVKNQDGNQ